MHDTGCFHAGREAVASPGSSRLWTGDGQFEHCRNGRDEAFSGGVSRTFTLPSAQGRGHGDSDRATTFRLGEEEHFSTSSFMDISVAGYVVRAAISGAPSASAASSKTMAQPGVGQRREGSTIEA